jgi:hypothetical protein
LESQKVVRSPLSSDKLNAIPLKLQAFPNPFLVFSLVGLLRWLRNSLLRGFVLVLTLTVVFIFHHPWKGPAFHIDQTGKKYQDNQASESISCNEQSLVMRGEGILFIRDIEEGC